MQYRVANEEDLAEGQLLSVQLPTGERVCLARADGKLYAIKDECTHADYPLSDGSVGPGCQIECALHGAVFDLRDGSVLGPPAMEAVQAFQVTVKEGGIWILGSDE
jgi:3-phenylpropionate/trans-cinnamate dioxygenase ferredoxin subunit